MDTTYWEDSTLQGPVKFENNLPYGTANNSEDDEFGFHGNKKKLARDPLSHRIIEKRRRDRMNSCLADLSRLIPHEYMKKGRGRVEKTEIIEMAIRRIKHLMSHTPCKDAECIKEETPMDTVRGPNGSGCVEVRTSGSAQDAGPTNLTTSQASPCLDSYRLGFAECLNETVQFLVQVEGMMTTDPLCNHLRAHLTSHCENILQNDSFRSRLCCSNSSSSGDEQKPSGANGFSTSSSQSTLQGQPMITGEGRFIPGSSNSGLATSCGMCAQQDSSGRSGNNFASPPWSSDKSRPPDDFSSPCPSYKFKHRIQERFERGAMNLDCNNGNNQATVVSSSNGSPAPPSTATLSHANNSMSRVSPTTLIPIFALAPSGCHYLASWIEAGSIPSYPGTTSSSSSSSSSISSSSSSSSSPPSHSNGHLNGGTWLSSHSVTISVDFGIANRSAQ